MTDTSNAKLAANPPDMRKKADDLAIIRSHVNRLFENDPPVRGQQCENPVIGGTYFGGADPVALQKRKVHRALLAREWFAVFGPKDAPPLPLCQSEIDEIRFTTPFNYVLGSFAHSLRAHDWDFNYHPTFKEFACGCTAVGRGPDLITKAEELRKRYPPRPLRYLNIGYCWDPPNRAALKRAAHRGSKAH